MTDSQLKFLRASCKKIEFRSKEQAFIEGAKCVVNNPDQFLIVYDQPPGRDGIGPVWESYEYNSLPLETPILVKHRYGIEAITFWNHAWKYWYSGRLVPPTVLQSITGFIVVSNIDNSTPSQDVSVLVAEIERLKSWKIQSSELLNPLLEYGQGRKDIPLGASITAYILMWAKKYHKQSAEIERLNGLIELAYSEGKKDGVDGFEGGWIMFKTENEL